MIHTKMEKAINEQINREYFSAYLYLSMSAHLANKGLPGFANWMRVQVEEETFHVNKFYNYVIERGGKVEFESIEKPKHEWDSLLELFEDALIHEKFISESINKLADVADEVKDRATLAFLQWFINEQVEEETNVQTVIDQLKLIGNEGNAMFLMDKEMATRVFTPPVNA